MPINQQNCFTLIHKLQISEEEKAATKAARQIELDAATRARTAEVVRRLNKAELGTENDQVRPLDLGRR
jgi:hypothetical protein